MFAAFLAFLIGSFAGPPPQEVQDEVAYQNCASSDDPAACQAALAD
jgi:hypothetical protein